MHWSSGGSTRDTETTVYALLFYAERKDADNGLKIVKWLVEQRNPNGGFGSTQVCLLVLFSLKVLYVVTTFYIS